MFRIIKCSHPGCTKPAISRIDENGNICNENTWCVDHIPSHDELLKLRDYIDTHETIVNLSLYGLNVNGIDLSDKKLFGCNMQHCTFSNLHATNLREKLCTLDFSTFTDCDFLNSNVQFTSHSGTKFVHVVFTGSDLINNNFNGTTAYQSSFDDCDLYNSRFIKAVLLNSSFNNCNLKKTIFYDSVRENVSFKLSNTREALVERGKVKFIEDLTHPDEGESDL